MYDDNIYGIQRTPEPEVRDGWDMAMGTTSAMAAGAKIGANFGPIGAGVGAVAGAAMGFWGQEAGKFQEEQQLEKAEQFNRFTDLLEDRSLRTNTYVAAQAEHGMNVNKYSQGMVEMEGDGSGDPIEGLSEVHTDKDYNIKNIMPGGPSHEQGGIDLPSNDPNHKVVAAQGYKKEMEGKALEKGDVIFPWQNDARKYKKGLSMIKRYKLNGDPRAKKWLDREVAQLPSDEDYGYAPKQTASKGMKYSAGKGNHRATLRKLLRQAEKDGQAFPFTKEEIGKMTNQDAAQWLGENGHLQQEQEPNQYPDGYKSRDELTKFMTEQSPTSSPEIIDMMVNKYIEQNPDQIGWDVNTEQTGFGTPAQDETIVSENSGYDWRIESSPDFTTDITADELADKASSGGLTPYISRPDNTGSTGYMAAVPGSFMPLSLRTDGEGNQYDYFGNPIDGTMQNLPDDGTSSTFENLVEVANKNNPPDNSSSNDVESDNAADIVKKTTTTNTGTPTTNTGTNSGGGNVNGTTTNVSTEPTYKIVTDYKPPGQKKADDWEYRLNEQTGHVDVRKKGHKQWKDPSKSWNQRNRNVGDAEAPKTNMEITRKRVFGDWSPPEKKVEQKVVEKPEVKTTPTVTDPVEPKDEPTDETTTTDDTTGEDKVLDDTVDKVKEKRKWLSGDPRDSLKWSSALHNLAMGSKAAEQVERRYMTPEELTYNDRSYSQRRAVAEQRNAANAMLRGKGLSIGQQQGYLAQTGAQALRSHEAINEREAQRADQIDQYNVGQLNQAKQLNINLANQYDTWDAQNRAARQKYTDQAMADVSELAQWDENKRYMMSRDAKADEIQMNTIPLIGTGQFGYDGTNWNSLQYRSPDGSVAANSMQPGNVNAGLGDPTDIDAEGNYVIGGNKYTPAEYNAIIRYRKNLG
jgi:hypothetical protein